MIIAKTFARKTCAALKITRFIIWAWRFKP
jgi:hypothetical protein